jgi:hypothetical protein
VAEGKLLPSFRELFSMLTTFMLTVFAWIFFRAEDLNHAFSYVQGIFSLDIFALPFGFSRFDSLITLIFIFIFIFIEWIGRVDKFAIEKILLKLNKNLRLLIYLIIASMIFLLKSDNKEFIYFQF